MTSVYIWIYMETRVNRGETVSRPPGAPSSATTSRGKLVTKWHGNIGNSLLLGACLLFALPLLRTRAEVVAKEARGGKKAEGGGVGG